MHSTYVTAAAAATATAVLDTGEGRQLINRVGHEFFDDVLGLDPQIARYLSSLTLHIAATFAFDTLYSSLGPLTTPGKADPGGDLTVDEGELASDDPTQLAKNKGRGGRRGSPPGGRKGGGKGQGPKPKVGPKERGPILKPGKQHPGHPPEIEDWINGERGPLPGPKWPWWGGPFSPLPKVLI